MSIIDTKITFFNFLPYECGAAEEYLENMALKGWLLQSAMGAYLKFKRIEPKKIKYSVDILQDVSVFDHNDSDDALEYREYCQAAGWNFVCEIGKIQIFFSENEEKTIPIRTDESEKFKLVLKSSFPSLGIQMLLTLIFALNIHLQLFKGITGQALASNLGLFTSIAMFSVIVTNIIGFISFLIWVIKAKGQLRKNEFMPYNKYKQIKTKNVLRIGYAVILLILMLKLTIFDNPTNSEFMLLVLVMLSVTILFMAFIRRHINKKRYSKPISMSISIGGFVISIYLTIVVVGGAAIWSITRPEKNKEVKEKAPLTFADFGYKESDNKESYLRMDESILAKRLECDFSDADKNFSYETFQSQYSWVVRFYEKRLFARLKNYGRDLWKINTNLPDSIEVYTDSEKSVYVLVSENKVVYSRKGLKNISESEFLNLVHNKLFK